jgi:acetyltransferase-like isoleucine patch superfamily enzyme
VVTKDLPAGVLAAGAPARVVRRLQTEPVRLAA